MVFTKLYQTVIFYLITLLFFSQGLFAQSSGIKSFSSDSIAFYEEMTVFLDAARPKDGKKFMKDFAYSWYGGKFAEEQRKSVYVICNKMLNKKGVLPFPDFENYLYAVQSLVESPIQTSESYNLWHQSLDKLLDFKKTNKFRDYLEMSFNLFEYNRIFKAPAVEWESSSSDFKFDFDSLPKLTFNSLNLRCFSKGDSAVIYNTSGVYYPTEKLWIGKGGKVNWVRAGFTEDEVFAEINNYQINFKSPTYEVDSVYFTHKKYFDKPLLGKLEEKVLANVREETASYPRFDSYNKRIVIKNIAEGVDYDGGFSMKGAKFIGSGNEEADAYLIFYREKAPFLIAASKSFSITTDKISSTQTAIKIILDKDSIYHPGLSFKFFMDKRQVALIRDYKGISNSPYFDSFHKIDMDFEALYWNIDENTMDLTNLIGGTKSDAQFESADIFKLQRFEKMQGFSNTHPFYEIKQLMAQLDTNVFYVEDLTKKMRISKEQAQVMLMNLSIEGFVFYDFDKEKVIVKDRLNHYYYSRSFKEDYDVLEFKSDIKGESNATLNLLNFDLKIKGVKYVLLSDSQQVYVFPKNQQLVLKKNRDFIFSGVIRAGKFDFFGKDFSFEYEEFKINLDNVDSLSLRADGTEKDEFGKPKQVAVKTVIEKINGELLIDNQTNKSGARNFAEYPKFTSFKESYVFYQRQAIQGGVYKKNNFYFQLTPFEIDSLDNFTNEGINFKGTFVSAGIFPDFDESLRLMDDYSLGFERETPPSGVAVYNGKGQYTSKIKLSNEGLKGDGKLEYITSTTYSNDFTFFPDSMRCIAKDYVIEEKPTAVEYPPVLAKNTKVRWLPKNDVMVNYSQDTPFSMYDGSTHTGSIALRPKGLTGDGVFKFEKAELEADKFNFKFQEFTSDTADFRLLDEIGSDALSFNTKNVNAYVNFKERFGEFKSNGGGSYIEFPQNKYICFMEEFKWFMDKNDIALSAKESGQTTDEVTGVALDGSKFISIHEKQDSLSFYAPEARYDINEKIIYCNNVKYVNVADAMIYPDSGKIVIEKNAKMNTLENAKIVANYITQNFNIYDATINVFGKKNYTGTGYVDYVDETQKVQPIFLENIGVDTTLQTYASGVIEDTANFRLSPQFDYFGRVFLTSNKEDLTFKGSCRIKHDCDKVKPTWFNINAQIDPENIYIPVDSMMSNEFDDQLFAAINSSPDSLGIYSSFFTRQAGRRDQVVINADGYLHYHKETGEYRVSSKDKIQEQSFRGNYISLNTKSCKVYGEGTLNLGIEAGQIKMQTGGNAIHNQIDNDAIFDLLMMVDFMMDESAMEKFAKEIIGNSTLDPINFERKTFEKALREIIGQTEADKLISQINLYGGYKKIPDELNKTIVFNEIKFKWDNTSKSYKSFGKIGIGNIYKTQVNKYINGKVELLKKRSGDVVTFYLEIDPNNWYFFQYTRGIMQVYSSNDEFNSVITEVKPDKRKYDHKKGEEPYQYMLSNDRKVRDFVKKFDINE